jgi:hypothetical protein
MKKNMIRSETIVNVLANEGLLNHIISFQRGKPFKHLKSLTEIIRVGNPSILLDKIHRNEIDFSIDFTFCYGACLKKKRKEDVLKMLNILFDILRINFEHGTSLTLIEMSRKYDLDIIKWFEDRQFPFARFDLDCSYINDIIMNCPKESGQVCVFYFINNLHYTRFSNQTLTCAAISGNVAVLEYLMHNYPGLFTGRHVHKALRVALELGHEEAAVFLQYIMR